MLVLLATSASQALDWLIGLVMVAPFEGVLNDTVGPLPVLPPVLPPLVPPSVPPLAVPFWTLTLISLRVDPLAS
jgi:hypothetical protein